MRKMKRVRYIMMLWCVLAVVAKCYAIDYSYILLQIDRNNLELKAMEARGNAEVDKMKLENTLPGPDVDFSYLFGADGTGDKWEIGASQSFEWLGVYHSRRKAINARKQSLSNQMEARRRDIHTEVLSLCVEAVNINKQIALYADMVADIDSLKSAYDKAFTQGEVSVLDVNKLKIENVSMLRKLRELQVRLSQVSLQIQALNGGLKVDCSGLLAYPTLQLPASKEDYALNATQKDPTALYFADRSKADRYEVSAAKRALLPSFNVGYRHVNELGDIFNGVTAGISIPLYGGRKSVKVAKSVEIANKYEANLWEQNVKAALFMEFEQVKKLQDELKLYESALPEDNIVLLNKALAAGHISLIEYLLEKRFYSEALIEKLEVEYQYYQALNNINRYNY